MAISAQQELLLNWIESPCDMVSIPYPYHISQRLYKGDMVPILAHVRARIPARDALILLSIYYTYYLLLYWLGYRVT